MAAPLPTPTGVARARMGFVIGTLGPYFAHFDIAYDGAGLTTAQLTDLCGDVATSWAAQLAGLTNPQAILSSIVCEDLQNPGTVDGVAAVSHAGTRTGTPLPDNVTAAIAFLPDHKYRGARPKTFLPAGNQEDLATGQHWTSAFTAAVDTAWTAFIGAVQAGAPAGVTLGAQQYVNYIGPPYTVRSNPNNTRSHSVGTPVNPPKVYPILEPKCATKIGSQRKRLGKPF